MSIKFNDVSFYYEKKKKGLNIPAISHINLEIQEKDEFVIYHGGVYSPIKGEFFRKIYEAVKNNFVEIYDKKKCNNEAIQNNYDLNKKSDPSLPLERVKKQEFYILLLLIYQV